MKKRSRTIIVRFLLFENRVYSKWAHALDGIYNHVY